MKLILLRHGESKWNLENRFTGWTDIALTSSGIEEASFSGKQLLKKNIKIVKEIKLIFFIIKLIY